MSKAVAFRVASVVCVLSLLGTGCNGGDDGESCTSGASESCTCADGTTGVKSCQSDGTFGSCRCESTLDTGGDLGDSGGGDVANDTFRSDVSDADTGGGADAGSGGALTNRLWSLYTSAKGVKTVEPGDGTLKPAVRDMQGSSHTTLPFTQDMIRLERGGTYRVDNPIRLREGQDLQAEGATIIPMNDDEPVFRFSYDALLWGGTVDLEGSGTTAFEPAGYYPNVEPVGILWTRPAGPLGTFVKAEPATGAMGMEVSFDERFPHGFTTPIFTTDGVDKPLKVGPIGGEHGWTNANEYYVRAKDYRTAVHFTGSQWISRSTRNRVVYDLFGGRDVEHAVEIDGDGVLLNIFEGKLRSLESHDPAINFAETADHWAQGQNIVMDYDGRSEGDFGDQYRDNSGASGNGLYAYGGSSIPVRGPGASSRPVMVAESSGGTWTASELQSVWNTAAEESSDVRIEPWTKVVSDGDSGDLVVPEGVAVDARGAVIEIDSAVQFEPGGLLLGGQVDKRTEGPALVVRADGDTIDRPTGPVMTVAMGYAHDDFAGADRSCDPALQVEAVNGGEITGLVNSYYAMMCSNGVDLRADASSRIADNRLFLAVNWGDYLLQMRGDGDIADNAIKGQLQPKGCVNTDSGEECGSSEAGWIIDGPKVRDNRVDGRIWDVGSIRDQTGDRPMIWIRETGGGNTYVPYGTQSQDRRGEKNSLRGDDSQFEQWGYTDMFENAPESYIQETRDDRLFAEDFMPAYWKPLPEQSTGTDGDG